MDGLARLPLGAPGIYPYPEAPLRALTGVRLDLCAFAGVAPRGPARVPVVDDESDGTYWPGERPCVEPERPRLRTVAVPIESFDEYLRLFGGFEGPGRLPYAVAAFFENGGQRALVARIVHDYGRDDKDAPKNDEGVARALIQGVKPPIGLRARNEGTWGAALTASLAFAARPVDLSQGCEGLLLGPGASLDPGALLRVRFGDGNRVLRFVARLDQVPDDRQPGRRRTRVLLDEPLLPGVTGFELLEASLTLDDGAGRVERHANLGLRLGHPRWLAQVLCDASDLAWPEQDWALGEVRPDSADLPQPPMVRFDRVKDLADRWDEIVPEDFFDRDWSPDSGEQGSGICCFASHRDAEGIGPLRPACLLVPDLYSPAPLAALVPVDPPVSLAGPTFARCVKAATATPREVPANDLPGLHLDPVLDLDAIQALQVRVVRFAESLRDLVALLDVPPGLDPARIRRWRGGLASSYAAAYHPWLQVVRRDDGRSVLVDLPPSAAAAGILAERELTLGVPQGPANRIAAGVVQVLAALPPDLHGELHQMGINCYVRERDGIRLTGARTLAGDPDYRQLSVRRLLILLRRVLLAQMQWAVFEPNGPALWREIRLLLDAYLRQLYRQGAMRGATEAEAFFVRCDEVLNPPYEQERGRLSAEVGVALAEPLEFIVLRLARGGDGTLTLSE